MTPLPPGSRVVAYARDSGGDEQERSVDQQIAEYQKLCAERGWVLTQTFTDRARPGSTLNRAGLEACLAHLRQTPRPCEGLLTWKLNRLARNQNESAYLRADLRTRGYDIISLADDIPDLGDLTFIFEDLLAWKAERDLRDLSTDIKRGLRSIVTARKPNGDYEGFAPGTPPTCYTRETVVIGVKRNGTPRTVSRWVPDPATWAQGQKAWAMRAAGHSLRAIHTVTKLFKTHYAYSTFFANPIYIGRFIFGGEVYENFVPPLCTPEQWAAVQIQVQARKAQAAQYHPRRANSPYTLSGLAHCANCQRRLVTRTSRHRVYRCPTCNQRWPAVTLEKSVVAHLDGVLGNPERLAQLAQIDHQRQAHAHAAQTAQAHALTQHIAALQKSIANLLDQLEHTPSPALRQRLAQREAELAQAQHDHQNLSTPPAPVPTHEHLQKISTAIRIIFENSDPAEIKILYNQITLRLELTKESGKLQYRLPLLTFGPERTQSDTLGALSIHTLDIAL